MFRRKNELNSHCVSGALAAVRGFALVGVLLCAIGFTANAETLSGRIVGIVDGDTVDFLSPDHHQVRLRLAEIDAPEHNQPWGQRSKQALSAMVFGKDVQIQTVTRDRYGRTVARLYIGPLDVNREMVRRGAAWAYRRYLTDPSILAAETNARTGHIGLWSLPTDQTIPPWEWRHPSSSALRPLPRRAPPGLLKADSSRLGSCGTKRYCREMASCAEAQFYLRQCGVLSLDGDHDGVPCEKLCGHSR